MNLNKLITLIFFVSLILLAGINSIAAEDNQTVDNLSTSFNQNSLETSFEEGIVEDSSNVVVVNDWDELQFYCSYDDKNYVLKLKENTNYYPSDVSDANCQIIVKNNVTIIGSSGAYIGDVSPQAGNIEYTPIKVEDDSGIGLTLVNITFKWISTDYQSDGVFLVMGGNAYNYISNCYFTNITTNIGHSSILHLKRGNAILTNCTFINCTTDFGCVSIYDPKDDPTKTCTGAYMEVNDCYFEGNYAKTEPGCINNCGILVTSNTTYYKNSAFWWAGAIHTHGGANTTIYDCDFIDNVAGWNGGALYTYSYLQIYNSRFIGNNCTTNNGGGAIGACKYLHAPYIHVEDSLFMNNENLCWGLDELSTSGTGRGGAISLMDEGGLELYNNTFIKNSASIGTAVCAISGGLSYGSPDVRIIGNRFINHTRIGDVLDVRLATGSIADIRDNYYYNNSIVFEKLKLIAEDPVDGVVNFHIDASLKNPKSYDNDILSKSSYDVYVNDVYNKTVSTLDFTLNFENGQSAYVYVVPYISNSKSNKVFAGIAKTYIYVSQKYGNDNNEGTTRNNPVKTLNKSIELAKNHDGIIILGGTYTETNLHINYNLTIIAENSATITVEGNAFNITDGDVKFINLTFKNSKHGSSTKPRLISQSNTGFLTLEGCTFDNNTYKTHIESKGILYGENILCTNNNDGSFIWCDSITLKSSIFINNTVTYSLSKSLIRYSSKTIKLEAENLTFIKNTISNGCIDIKKGSGTITNCNFIDNTVTVSNSRTSAIYMEDSASLVVQSCKFINNTDLGRYSSVIYIASGSLLIKDSILINNKYENDNNVIINGGENHLRKLIANNNWWGNTPDNLTKPPLKVFPKSNTLPNGWDPASYWLILNVSAISNEIELNQKIQLQFSFTQIDNEGNITPYDSYYLPNFDLNLSPINGTCDDNKITLEKGIATTYFTLTDKTGSLTGSFNGVNTTINFQYIKSTPAMIINAENITYGQSAQIEITLPSNVNGEITIKINNITQTKTINSSKTIFTIPNLPVGNFTIKANYTGDEFYNSVVNTTEFSVNKAPSNINVTYEILNKNAVLSFTLSNDATGSIDIYVNNQYNGTINVGETYILPNISRGNYLIKAMYSGDVNYLKSENEFYFEVDKLKSSFTVNVSNITYGNDAIVNVNINDDATGNITVTVDGKSFSSKINNGKATITIPNLNAGQKIMNITYTGDNNYNASSVIHEFNIAKAKIDFNITSNDVKVGKDVIIEIKLPARCGGTITLTGVKTEIKNVPITGLVKITYSDLTNATYTVFAEYNGDNYESITKSINFTVSQWNDPQWGNPGGNIKHDGKSSYDSSVNGEIKWINELNNISGNLAIDSEGNLYVIANDTLYSFDSEGNLRWNYKSNGAGDYFAGITIYRDVIILPRADDTLYFINQTTGQVYGHANIYQGSSYYPGVVDFDANIYISGQGDANNPNLIIVPYKLWENGGNPIVIPLGSSPVAAPTIINDEYVVVPCADSIKIVDISSKILVNSKSGNIKSFSVVGEGNIIYSIIDDSIVAMDLSGANVWSSKVTGDVGNQLFLDSEHGVYAVSKNGTLYKYDLIDGKESKFTNLTVTSGILIGNEGEVYFASYNSFYALNSAGNILWKSILDSNITGTPIMDKNGVIYINSLDKVYALKQSPLKDVNLSIECENIHINQTETITITFNENSTGIVEITVNGDTYIGTITDGKIIKTFDNLTANNYTLSVKYSGDSRFSSITKTSEFLVSKYLPMFNVTSKDISADEVAIFNVHLNNDASGIVQVTVDGISNSSKIIDGFAKITLAGLTSGIKEAIINYIGDNKYLSRSVSKSFTVGPLSTIISNISISKDYKITGYLKDIKSNPISNAMITYIIDNTVNNVSTGNDGSFTIQSAPGQVVNIYFNGNDNLSSTNTTVKVSNASISIINTHFNINNNTQLNMYTVDYSAGERGGVLKVQLLDSNGNPINNTIVRFSYGNNMINLTTDNDGIVIFELNSQSSNIYQSSLYYGGSEIYNSTSVFFTIRVNKKPISIIAKSKKFKAKTKTKKYFITLKTSKCSSKDGKIYLKSGMAVVMKIKNKTFTAKINSKGKATFKLTKFKKKGKFKGVISFNGGSVYNSLSKTVKIKIK